MANPFDQWNQDQLKADLQICIFPHIRDFLIIDLEGKNRQVKKLNMNDVFDSEFFDATEKHFAQSLRNETSYPFLHTVINMPSIVEEFIKDLWLSTVLDKLGLSEQEAKKHRISVMMMTKPALSLSIEDLRAAFTNLFHPGAENQFVEEVLDHVMELIAEEKKILAQLERKDLLQVLEKESPNFFTLWENRE